MLKEVKKQDKEVYIKDVEIEDRKVTPWIVISKSEDTVEIYINRTKKFRILDNKNIIQTALDICLVDMIKNVLKNLADKEKKIEEVRYGNKV